MALFIPGICGIIGSQGSGKSFAGLKLGLMYANQLEYDIAFNFAVDFQKLYFYCLDMGYTWLAHRIYKNKAFFQLGHDLEEFMRYPKTLYILDEAGVYLNTRKWKTLDGALIDSLAQIRHDGKLLWWIAQYDDMVDKLLRMLTSSYIYVNSGLRHSKKLGNNEIIWQAIYLFESKAFKVFNAKVLDKVAGLKFYMNCRRLSHFHIEGPLSTFDRKLFDCYQSFGSRVGDDDIPKFHFRQHPNKFLEFQGETKKLDLDRIVEEVLALYPDYSWGFDY